MRVALVCPYSWDRFGGVQTHVRELAGVLSERGHETIVIAPASSGDLELAALDGGPRVVIAGRAIRIPANGSIATLSFGPRVAGAVRSTLEDFAPDVVHVHEPLIPSLSMLAVLGTDAPVVGTWHAATDASFGYRAAKPVLQKVVRRVTVRTAVSDAARHLASRYFPGRYELTPNGVDTKRFADAAPLDLGGGRKVLFFGRIERRKGLDVLIQAMTRVRDLDVTLVIGGTGPHDARCRRLARQLQIDATWLGRVDDADVPSLYSAADVYCAPGLGGESFGIVLVEAMAAGAPVVCSDLSGFRAVAGGAAILVPPGEPGPLADALRNVLTDDDTAGRMRAMSRRLAGGFDWPRLAAGVEALYERALQTKS
jgi:phosphatidylinositol alpha-mannosyltransferase